MNYIKKNGKIVATLNPSEVTKENFVVEPGGENRVWCKLELYEFDSVTGEKKTLRNQIMGENPGDFELMAPIWKRQGMTITMLHDPRSGMQADGVEAKLDILNKKLKEEEEAKAEAKAKAEEEARVKAEAEAVAKAMAEGEAKRKEAQEKAETMAKPVAEAKPKKENK